MSSTHQVEMRLRNDTSAPDRGILPGLHLILGATTRAACHSAIAQTAALLEALFGFSILLVAEATEFGNGPVIVWKYAGTEAFADMDVLVAWLRRAQTAPGRTLAFGAAAAGLMVSGADEPAAPQVLLVADGASLPAEVEIAMRDVAEFSARHLFHLNREEEMHRRQCRDITEAAKHQALLRAQAELSWEAGADGILHVTEIFHGRRDLAQKLAGRALTDITPFAAAIYDNARKEPRSCRHQITLPGESGDLLLATYADPHSADGMPLRGTITALVAGQKVQPLVEVRLLENVVAARQREEHLRRETEVMMLGLRALLSDMPFREKLEQLARHLTSAIGCDEARLVLVRPGDKPRLIMPQDVSLDARAIAAVEGWEGPSPIRLLPEGDAAARRLRQHLNLPPGDVLAIDLPSSGEHYHLICRTRRSLSQDDYGIIERISLLLRQALLIQEDQKQMIHAAKLSALGQMSTGIAHELRQPLNAISIAAQNIDLLLEMDKLGPIALREKTGRILAQIDRASRIMDRMRRFGRKTVGDHKPVNVAAMARSARSLMDAVITGAGVAFEIAVPDELTVMAEELEIEQVLVNLIQNAADALSERQNGHIRIWSSDDPEDAALVRLNAEDNGPGFPPEVEKHALDAFFTTKPEGKGTGLGLSIAHSILREHGGRILIGTGPMGGGLVTLILRRPEARLIPFTPRPPSETVPA